MLVTDNHEVIYKKSKITVKDLALDKTIRESNFPMTGFSDTILNIEDNWIRLLTWVIMDGTIVHDKKYSTKKRVQFHISKERKIITIKQLLSDMNIPFSFRLGKKQENKLQDVYINIYSIYAREICYRLNNQKKIPFDWTLFSNKQFFIFLSTLSDTDGHKRKEMVNSTSIVWSTISENDRDIVSIMCLKNNFIFKFVNKVSHGYANGKIQFSCSINENVLTRDDFVSIKDIQYNDFVYCFTMPRGTLITRRGGKIAFAGNCLQYMKGIEVYEKYSGFQNYGYLDIQEALEENMDLLQPVYQSDDYLISHAGISKTFLKSLHTDNPLDINQKFKENRMCLAFNGDNCYGDDVTQGCLWIRPNSLLKDALDDYKQIVGHTRKDVITTVDNITFIDCLDSKVEAFIF